MSEILSVTCCGVEFLCEQEDVQVADPMMPGDYITEQTRSKWYSKDGKELSDATAMKLLNFRSSKIEKDKFIKKLWGDTD